MRCRCCLVEGNEAGVFQQTLTMRSRDDGRPWESSMMAPADWRRSLDPRGDERVTTMTVASPSGISVPPAAGPMKQKKRPSGPRSSTRAPSRMGSAGPKERGWSEVKAARASVVSATRRAWPRAR